MTGETADVKEEEAREAMEVLKEGHGEEERRWRWRRAGEQDHGWVKGRLA